LKLVIELTEHLVLLTFSTWTLQSNSGKT